MQKTMPKFDSITHFIQTSGFNYRVYEMGRKILPLSKQQFQQIEDQQAVYPFPFKQRAWLALLVWQPTRESEAVVWFLQFPVDELGYLKQQRTRPCSQRLRQPAVLIRTSPERTRPSSLLRFFI